MSAPFYFLVLPPVLIVGTVLWLFYVRITHDKDCNLRRLRNSRLEEAQEMERLEAELERKIPRGSRPANMSALMAYARARVINHVRMTRR